MQDPERSITVRVTEGMSRYIERRPFLKRAVRGVFVLAAAGALRELRPTDAFAEVGDVCPAQGIYGNRVSPYCDEGPNPIDCTTGVAFLQCPSGCSVCTTGTCTCPWASGWWQADHNCFVCLDCKCGASCDDVCVCRHPVCPPV